MFKETFARFKELDDKDYNSITEEEDRELDDLRDKIYSSLEQALKMKKVAVELETDPSDTYYLQAEAVVSIEGSFFKFSFCFNSWVDDGCFGDCDALGNLREVFPVQKVVTVYE